MPITTTRFAVDLEQYLSSKTDCEPSVDADTLKLYGHKAATQFVGGQAPMNDSIVQMAKEAGLNHEQVKRVVEHANNAAFSQMFKAGFSQNVTFQMADTSAVLQSLESPMQVKQASVEIVRGSRYVPGQERVSLESAFGYNAITRALEKTAAPAVDRAELTKQYLDKIGHVRKMRSDIEILADAFELKTAELDNLVKRARAEGHDAEVIGSCVDAAGASQVVSRYLAERYGSTVKTGSLHKLAQAGMEMVANPITDAVTTLQDMQEQLFQLQSSIEQAQQQVGAMLMTMQQPAQNSPAERLFSSAPARMAGPPPPQSPPSVPLAGPPPGQLESAPEPM
jgi:hypothetical protein